MNTCVGLQQIIANVASRLIGAGEAEMDDAIEYALRQFGQWYEVDRAYLFRYSRDGTCMDNTHEWCAPGAPAQKHRVQQLPVARMPWWQAAMARLAPIHIPYVKALPAEADAEKNEFLSQHIESLLALPMNDDERGLIGFIGLDTVRRIYCWPLEDIHLLQVVAEIFANVISRNERHHWTEGRYSRLVKATQGFVYSATLLGDGEVYTPQGAGVERVTGYTSEAHRQQPQLWLEQTLPEDRPLLMQYIGALRAGQEPPPLEYRIMHKDGSIRWVRNIAVVERDTTGTVVGYDGLLTDITERKQAEQERDKLLSTLRHMAVRDAMTGLLNRRGFSEELERTWHLSQRHPFPIGLLIADIDHFKSVNDTYGHLVGDEVIKEYAELVQAAMRDTDIVARYGGDELVVILPWSTLEEVRHIGERLCARIREHRFCTGDQELKITVSLGAHAVTPQAADDLKDFISLTDRALYQAKQNGRNQLWLANHLSTRFEPMPSSDYVLPAIPASTGQVLVVDDESDIRAMLSQLLTAAGYAVLLARNVEEALQHARNEKSLIDVAVVDLLLDGQDGLDLITQLRALDDLMVPLVITGEATLDRAVEALRTGAYDFIQKPFTARQLIPVVGRALGRRRLLLENRRYQKHLEAMVAQRGRSLTRALDEQRKSAQFALEAMASLIEAREKKTGAHCRRMAELAVILAGEMNVAPEELESIRTGALLHDIGKIAIPDNILLKEGPLTDAEWTIMKTHPQIGHQIIASNPSLRAVAEMVLSHQEKYDGTGYPRGLAGEEIALGARIFAVVDAYDAMRADRHYQPSLGPDEALAEIQQHAGTQFDPEVVAALRRCQGEIELEIVGQHEVPPPLTT